MGVGNFRGKFEENGILFSMRPSYPSEEDFEAYKAEYRSDYGDPYTGDIDDYRQELYRQEWEDLKEAIGDALSDRFDFSSPALVHSEWASFSDEFSLVMRNKICEVGVHDYHGSYLVAVAPDAYHRSLIEEGGEVQAIGEFAMSLSEATDKITDVAQGIGDFLRSKLQEKGLDLSYRTGAWTSGSFAERTEDEFRVEQETFASRATEALKALQVGPTIDHLIGDGETRRKMILAVDAQSQEERKVGVATFVYDADGDAVLVFDASEGDRIYGVPHQSSDALRLHLRGLGLVDGLHTLTEDDVTRGFVEEFAKAQIGREEWLIPVFASEAEALFERPLVISFEGERFEFESEEVEARPVAAPRP